MTVSPASDRTVRTWWLVGCSGVILTANAPLVFIGGRAPAIVGWTSAILGLALVAVSAAVLRGLAKMKREEGPGRRPFDIGKPD